MTAYPTVPCKWCQVPTRWLAAEACDNHLDLHQRIAREPDVARQMLQTPYDVTKRLPSIRVTARQRAAAAKIMAKAAAAVSTKAAE